MAGDGDAALAAGCSGGTASPDGPGPDESGTAAVVEQESGQHQAQAGTSRGPYCPAVAPQMAISSGGGRWGMGKAGQQAAPSQRGCEQGPQLPHWPPHRSALTCG